MKLKQFRVFKKKLFTVSFLSAPIKNIVKNVNDVIYIYSYIIYIIYLKKFTSGEI